MNVWSEKSAWPDGMYSWAKIAEIGGFYVSRFEIGWENNKCISKRGVTPLTPTQNKAIDAFKNYFIKTQYAKTCLMSEEAYDCMMAFVNGKVFGNGEGIFNVTTKFTGSALRSTTGSVARDRVANIYDLGRKF